MISGRLRGECSEPPTDRVSLVLVSGHAAGDLA
nr:MAG TPA: hypothetical protein [Caudoviricetes sp.]